DIGHILVRPAEGLDGLGEHLLDLIFAGYVRLHHQLAAGAIGSRRLGECAGGLRPFRAAAIVDRHVGALAGEPYRDRLSDSGGRAGDQNVLSFEPLHVLTPVLFLYRTLFIRPAASKIPLRATSRGRYAVLQWRRAGRYRARR